MNDDCVLQHTGQSIDYNEITNSFPDKVFIIQWREKIMFF